MHPQTHSHVDVAELVVQDTHPNPRAILTDLDLDRAPEWVELAKSVVIHDQESYDGCIELLAGNRALQLKGETDLRPMIKKAYAAHQEACSVLNRVITPLLAAEGILKAKIGIWTNEQARIERERQDAIRRAQGADRKREMETIRLEAEAKQAAMLLEAEKAIELAEAAGAKTEEVKAVIAEAERQVEAVAAEAQAVMAEVERAPMVVSAVQPAFEKAKGVATRQTHSAEVVNMKALLAYVLANPMYLGLLQVNQPALDQMARTLQSNFKMPGCELRVKTTVAAPRGGK